MAQINLKADNAISQDQKNTTSIFSLVLGIFFILLSVGAYGAANYFVKETDRKIENIEAEKTQLNVSFGDEKYKDMYFFEDRLQDLKTKLATDSKKSKVLDEIAKATLAETTYQTIKILDEAGSVSVEASFTSKNYDKIAKQIKAFNLIPKITSVVPEDVRKESGSDDLLSKVTLRISTATEEQK